MPPRWPNGWGPSCGRSHVISPPAEDPLLMESPDPDNPEDSEVFESPEEHPSGESAVSIYDPLRRYLVEIRKYPYLSREEEKAFALQLHEQGDLQAATQLILSHLRLAAAIAMEYKHLPFETLDLIQEGNIGLMQGIKKFDPYKNIRVATYVSWWIRAYVLKYILNNWRLVKIGTTEGERKLFFQLSRQKAHLERMGYEASPKLLADQLQVKETEVISMAQRLGSQELSLDQPLGHESEETLGQVIATDAIGVDEQLADLEFRQLFQSALDAFSKTLNPRDQDLLAERILAEEPKTLEALGTKYKISKERVRQLEANLMKKLKKYIESRLKPEAGGY